MTVVIGPLWWLDDASLDALLAALTGTAYPKDRPVYAGELDAATIEAEVRRRARRS